MSELILFQGDSITDCDRNRQAHIRQGFGYATMVQGQLGYECPGKYDFLNRGISGNRIVDVYARIKADIINLKPDYMSLAGTTALPPKSLKRSTVCSSRRSRKHFPTSRSCSWSPLFCRVLPPSIPRIQPSGSALTAL